MEEPVSDVLVEMDNNTKLSAAEEGQNELIVLDTTGKRLNVGPAYQRRVNAAIENRNKFVVSFVGCSTSGKSYTLRGILGDQVRRPVIVNLEELTTATTSNVVDYVSSKNVTYLDFEGEDGKQPILQTLRGVFRMNTEEQNQREKAVKQHFPKLAYILSDVVILIGKDELATTRYINRAIEFAQQANQGVGTMPHNPALILIQNKASLQMNFNIEHTTKTVRSNTDFTELDKYFSEIHCVLLPDADVVLKKSKLDGEKIFNQQIVALEKLIEEIRNRTSVTKQEYLGERSWLLLLKMVLDRLTADSSVSLYSLLTEINALKEETIDIPFKTFISLYENSSGSPADFEKCRSLSLDLLAHTMAIELINKNEESSLIKEKQIHKNCTKLLSGLWSKIERFLPCEAEYPSMAGVYCWQPKHTHKNQHKTGVDIKRRTILNSLFYPADSFRDVWSGSYISTHHSPWESIQKEFSNKVIALYLSYKNQPLNLKHKSFQSHILERPQFEIRTYKLAFGICSCCLKIVPYTPGFKKYNSGDRDVVSIFDLITRWIWPKKGKNPSTSIGVCDSCFIEFKEAALWKECCVCLEKSAEVMFLPCHHFDCCNECSAKPQVEKECPLCRTPIQEKIVIYNSNTKSTSSNV